MSDILEWFRGYSMQNWVQDFEKDKEVQEREVEEKERKEEQDDFEEIQKIRVFDDWKDGGILLSYLQIVKNVNQIM